jgi:hypothetical protein
MSRHAPTAPALAIEVAERETACRNQLALKTYQAGRGVSQPRSSRTARPRRPRHFADPCPPSLAAAPDPTQNQNQEQDWRPDDMPSHDPGGNRAG